MTWRRLEDWLAAGTRGCLVTLLEVRGSSPREAGARMLVREGGNHSGSIGGGALEWQALAEAEALLSDTPTGRGLQRKVALGPELGQCCGGAVHVLLEAFALEDLAWISAMASAESSGTFASVGVNDARGIYLRTPAAHQPAEVSLGIDQHAGLLREVHGTQLTPLLLFGAGHVGRALVMALAPLPFSIRWIDPRLDAFPAYLPANTHTIHAADPEQELAELPAGTLVLVMTHSHALDLAIVSAALQQAGCAFLGLIGSETKKARFISRLDHLGLGEAGRARLVCPIGIPGLRDKHPAVIAASVSAQLLGLRERMLR